MEYNYQQLKVWKKSFDLVRLIYRITDRLPSTENDILTKQMRKSAVSVESNIVEGRNRNSRKSYAQFVNIAYASAKELESQLTLVLSMKLSCEDEVRQALLDLDEIMAMLYKLHRSLLYLP